jgi:hypothetical protein
MKLQSKILNVLHQHRPALEEALGSTEVANAIIEAAKDKQHDMWELFRPEGGASAAEVAGHLEVSAAKTRDERARGAALQQEAEALRDARALATPAHPAAAGAAAAADGATPSTAPHAAAAPPLRAAPPPRAAPQRSQARPASPSHAQQHVVS